MDTEEHPVCGRNSRLSWLITELKRQLASRGATVEGPKSIVGWYMSYGFYLGFNRTELEGSLHEMPDLQALAKGMSDDDVLQGKPAPTFTEGESVEVIVNARNITYHCGTVCGLSWHHKEGKWFFVLEENGKKVSKRYEAKDLRPIRDQQAAIEKH